MEHVHLLWLQELMFCLVTPKIQKKFKISRDIESLRHMHESLNIDKK